MVQPWKLGPPVMDFSPIGQLGNTFFNGLKQGRALSQENERQNLINEAMAKNGGAMPGLSDLAAIAFRTGDTASALNALGLAGQTDLRSAQTDIARQELAMKQREQAAREASQGRWNSMFGGGNAPQPSGAAPSSGRGYDRPEAKRVYDAAIARGLTPVQAAAFTGSALAESSYRTDARNPGDGRDGTDSVGLFQWNSARARNLQAFAAQRGKDWRDKDVQLEYAFEEMGGPESFAGQALRNARTPQEATAAMLHYLRPAGYTRGNPLAAGSAQARMGNTQALLGLYGGAPVPQQAAPQPMPAPVAQAPDGTPVQQANAPQPGQNFTPRPMPAQAPQMPQAGQGQPSATPQPQLLPRTTGGPMGRFSDDQLMQAAGDPYLPEPQRRMATEELNARRQIDTENRRLQATISAEDRRTKQQIDADDRRAARQANQPPTGYERAPDGTLRPIAGGPEDPAVISAKTKARVDPEKAGNVPSELAARVALGNQFLDNDLPKINGLLDGFDRAGVWDSAKFRSELATSSGAGGALNRRMQTGLDALRRNLTGAGMGQGEADEYAKRYLPGPLDNAKTMREKVEGLKADLMATRDGALAQKNVKDVALTGRTATPNRPASGQQMKTPNGVTWSVE
jgi:hypothetical protein